MDARGGLGAAAPFAAAMFVSAALLFCVQPMAAKMLLPLLGGAPAVWTACMVFFQASLLAGYLYAHASLRRLGARRQAILHAALVLVPLATLPFHIGAGGGYERRPVTSVISLLAVAVGPSFCALAATAPLLQGWFTGPDDARRRDPYFLYAASNLGSMLALAAYPLLLEPRLDLGQQARLWRAGYVGLIALVWLCAALTWRARGAATSEVAPEARPPGRSAPARAACGPPAADRPVTPARRLRWIALAFVPSTLLLGATTFITTDVAAIPLLWVIPLMIYLGSFILVFARGPGLGSHAWMVRRLPLAATVAAMVLAADLTGPAWLVAGAHLAMLAVACMVCHGELAADRPAPAELTAFYLWMSVGGVLGGLFNSLIAPALLNHLAEYPLAMVLACACRPAPPPEDAAPPRFHALRRDAAHALALLALTSIAIWITQHTSVAAGDSRLGLAALGLPLLVNFAAAARPRRFAFGLGAVLLASGLRAGALGPELYRERNFFGVLVVTRDPAGRFRQVMHGRVVHGRQSLDPARRREPLSYYHPTGPVGDVFALLEKRAGAASRVGIIGLGAGAMACYARPGQTWTFYEINPAVARVASDPALFTYLSDAFPAAGSPGGPRMSLELGDARLRLSAAAPGSFDLLALDAFSSDAIPVHLLTREAFALYLDKLTPRGLLLAHISNVYLDLAPPLAAAARDAGLVAYLRDDIDVPRALQEIGKEPSRWVALARPGAGLEMLPAERVGWAPIEAAPDARAWTDDFSDVVSALR